jgi:arylsulfatase A-like enzyme
VAALILLAPAFVLFRLLYKRFPWSAAETAAALAAGLALALLLAALSRVGAKAWGANGTKAATLLSRCAPFLFLIPIPALVRGVPAARNEIAAEFRPVWSSAAVARANPGDAGPNLLLLTIDTIRADSFGACGDPVARTPHFDRFARRSRQFPICIASSPWTLPSLASLLTGRYPGEHKVLEALTAPPDSVRSLAEILLHEGRSTAGFVSNPWLATGTLARGFETFDVAERLECYGEIRSTQLYRALSKSLLRARQLDRGEKITDRGLRWIESASRRDRPWFAWLHYFDPHLPNWVEPPLDRLEGPAPRHVDVSITVEQIREGKFSGGDESRQEIERLYRGEVAATDRAIGRVLRQLESWDLFDRTVVVLTGDHGEEFWEHGDYGHGHAMYDEVVRVPLLLSAAPIEGVSLDGRMARIVDLAPTILTMLGTKNESERFSGSSLVAAGTDEESEAYGEGTLYGPEKKFLRSEKWKIVLTPPADSTSAMAVQIFDLEIDPEERRDLSRENSVLADSLMPRILQWIQRVGSSRTTSSGSLPGTVDPSIEDQLRALGYIQ